MKATPQEVPDIFSEMSADSRALIQQTMEICWYSRGSINYDQAWGLSQREKKIFFDMVKENIKRTEESGIPLI